MRAKATRRRWPGDSVSPTKTFFGTTVIQLESGDNGPTGKLWDNEDFQAEFGVNPYGGAATVLGMNGDANAQSKCYSIGIKVHRDSIWVDCVGADIGAFRLNWIVVIAR